MYIYMHTIHTKLLHVHMHVHIYMQKAYTCTYDIYITQLTYIHTYATHTHVHNTTIYNTICTYIIQYKCIHCMHACMLCIAMHFITLHYTTLQYMPYESKQLETHLYGQIQALIRTYQNKQTNKTKQTNKQTNKQTT